MSMCDLHKAVFPCSNETGTMVSSNKIWLHLAPMDVLQVNAKALAMEHSSSRLHMNGASSVWT